MSEIKPEIFVELSQSEQEERQQRIREMILKLRELVHDYLRGGHLHSFDVCEQNGDLSEAVECLVEELLTRTKFSSQVDFLVTYRDRLTEDKIKDKLAAIRSDLEEADEVIPAFKAALLELQNFNLENFNNGINKKYSIERAQKYFKSKLTSLDQAITFIEDAIKEVSGIEKDLSKK